jgi:hypothetical protein
VSYPEAARSSVKQGMEVVYRQCDGIVVWVWRASQNLLGWSAALIQVVCGIKRRTHVEFGPLWRQPVSDHRQALVDQFPVLSAAWNAVWQPMMRRFYSELSSWSKDVPRPFCILLQE